MKYWWVLIIAVIFLIYQIIDYLKTLKKIQDKRKTKIDKIHQKISNQDNYINEQYIDILHNQVEKQDKYINKQIVTRQYREQKAKKDGK